MVFRIFKGNGIVIGITQIMSNKAYIFRKIIDAFFEAFFKPPKLAVPVFFISCVLLSTEDSNAYF